MKTVLLLALALCGSLAAPVVPAAAPKPLAARVNAASVSRFGMIELTLNLSTTYKNPFDPDEMDVTATFSGPGKRFFTVNGFYDQPYTRRLVDGKREEMTRDGAPAWKVRFTPNAVGKWTYRVSVKDASGSRSATGAFTVTASSAPGFIRRSPKSHSYLRRDDGSTFFIVGENVGWAGDRGTYEYEDWYTALGKAKANWARVWMVANNMGLEWTPSAPGRWSRGEYAGVGRYALDNAERVDLMLDIARKNGIAVMLCLGTYGDLKEDAGYFGEGNWKNNPYNIANGGPCHSPAEFFTLPAARKLYRQRLRYLVARYAHSPQLFAWEFWNEFTAPAPWVDEMSRYLKTIDPYRHLVSNTYGTDAVWRLPTVDFTMNHHYGDGGLRDSAPIIAAQNMEMTTTYKKPHLMAEFGIDWKKSDRDSDPKGHAINFHNGLWASAMTRGMGGAALWWWDNYVHPLNLYHEFTPLADFAARIPWAESDWTPLTRFALHQESGPETFSDLVVPAQYGWGKPPGAAEYTLRPDGQVTGGMVTQFLYSMGKADLRTTPRFHLDLKRRAKFSVKVGQVMTGGTLKISVDGAKALEKEFPTGEGKGPWKSTEAMTEYNTWRSTYDQDVTVELPPGKHVVMVENAAGDWMQVSEYRVSDYRSSRYPMARVYAQRSPRQVVVWIQDERSNWVEDAAGVKPQEWKGLTLRLSEITAPKAQVTWWDTRKGVALVTETAIGGKDGLMLKVPAFRRDIAAVLALTPG